MATRLLKIERQESGQEFVVGKFAGPAVGGEDGGVELLVREVEPGRALVVEIRERALLELLRALGVFGHEPRITHRADSSRHTPCAVR
jgi:hypothetical protein